ncbi:MULTISPECIES: cache domain-containing protein [Pseudomonas]|uniref:Calcium channel protein n=2 Tax=Pseudomonas TaxID=286 RepID=A0A2Z4RT67_PSEPU|nr:MULTISPECIES: cache domain-containing protein [Pseudomonas]AWY44381.1 calcium channel protein [Pseudomonas putida]BCX67819.1 cache domain-containing protein [Pseudomonas izuensis]
MKLFQGAGRWVACWIFLLITVQAGAAEPQDDGQGARALLERAVLYYQEHHESAMAAFSRQGDFVDNNCYVLVLNTSGVMLASGGPSSYLIGKNVGEVLPKELKTAFSEALRTESGQGVRKAQYHWKNWSGDRDENKVVYYRRVDDKLFAVGYFISRESAENARLMLDKVADAIASNPASTLDAINQANPAFRQDDLYPYVIDLNSRRFVAHGLNKRLLGVDFSTLKDAHGQPLGAPILRISQRKGTGEYQYLWTNPLTNRVENKHAFFRRVGSYLVAVGYYQDKP